MDKKVAQWITNQRKALQSGTLSEDQIELLNQDFPGWQKTSRSDEAWFDKAIELKDAVSQLGRFPKNTERMGSWLQRQRSASKGTGGFRWTPERQEYMDTHFPGWLENSFYDKLWLENAEELKRAYSSLGSFPKKSEEIGGWLHNQRRVARSKGQGKWTPERQEYMDTHFPGWLD